MCLNSAKKYKSQGGNLLGPSSIDCSSYIWWVTFLVFKKKIHVNFPCKKSESEKKRKKYEQWKYCSNNEMTLAGTKIEMVKSMFLNKNSNFLCNNVNALFF